MTKYAVFLRGVNVGGVNLKMAEVATALKLGTTGLVLQLIEEGHTPLDLEIHEPVETMQELSQDQNRQWIVRLQSGKTISATPFGSASQKRTCVKVPLPNPGVPTMTGNCTGLSPRSNTCFVNIGFKVNGPSK